METCLVIEGLRTRAGGRDILRGVNLVIPEGETHVLFGPNGSGKSSLIMAVMGSPFQEITGGRIIFQGQDITRLPAHERARLGIGVAFQRPAVVKGVRLRTLLEAILDNRADMEALADSLMLQNHLARDVNLGFSGGEAKRSELLQLAAQGPRLVLLDEPESGVDLESMTVVGKVMAQLLQRHVKPMSSRRVSGLIVTHTGYALDYITAEQGHVMVDGEIICSGNPREMLETIRTEGFEPCVKCPTRALRRA